MNNPSSANAPRRGASTLAALVIGLPLAAGIVLLFRFGPLRHSPISRYVEYTIQWVTVAFFCVTLGALLVKWLRLRVEFDSLDRDILPRWDGKPAPVEKASDLLSSLTRLPEQIQETYLGRRIRAVLDFLCQRRSTAQFDDHLRSLADTDAMTQENSFGLVKFLTWAMPILGFLGTVLGITEAITGVTPEVLEEGMGQLTGGLAEAFNSTALALALTMAAMFLTFLVEKREQTLIEEVDRVIEQQLAHRFGSSVGQNAPGAEMSESLTRAIEGLIVKQGELWASALHEPERRAAAAYQQMTERFVAGLHEAMQKSLGLHEERLKALEQQSVQGSAHLMQQLAGLAVAVRDTAREQQSALIRVAEGVAAQAGVLGKIQEDENNLVHLQAVLHQNLAALASASSFEEAVHSLTAAVHLLTNRVGTTTPMSYPRKAA